VEEENEFHFLLKCPKNAEIARETADNETFQHEGRNITQEVTDWQQGYRTEKSG
jgi:hypothetical protein